jgi:hypothetical protein
MATTPTEAPSKKTYWNPWEALEKANWRRRVSPSLSCPNSPFDSSNSLAVEPYESNACFMPCATVVCLSQIIMCICLLVIAVILYKRMPAQAKAST